MKVTLTHKGWFGICPVYFGGLYTEAPHVYERHWLLAPLMSLSEWCYAATFFVGQLMNPEFEPGWPLRITGELKKPIEVEAP